MYQTYLWNIKPLSSYVTPWQSDTIYGHFFWGVALLEGEDELKKILAEFEKNNPPFIVSDGFVDNRLPMISKRVIKNSEVERMAVEKNESIIDIATKIKRLKKVSTISLELFNKLRKKENDIVELVDEILDDNSKNRGIISIENTHNRIDRLSGSTGENAIFSLKENFVTENIFIYIKVREDYPINKLEKILRFVEENGFGKKVSIGKGAFKTESFERFDGFEKISGNAFISLSNYIPKEEDYEYVENSLLLIKRGKVANLYGDEGNPFKKPFSCFRAGAIFRGKSSGIKGRVLTNLHRKKIIQVGIPFIVEVEL